MNSATPSIDAAPMRQPMIPERLHRAYGLLFPPRLRRAHLALVMWAEDNREDHWPTPSDVHNFAKLYRVPVGTLGGLVGMLSRYHPGARPLMWLDAVRNPVSRYEVSCHDEPVLRAFGWFLHSVDLGWVGGKLRTSHLPSSNH